MSSYICVSKRDQIWYRFDSHRWRQCKPPTKEVEYTLDPRFEDKLDRFDSLIGFNNGVYDLSKGKFREGYELDRVSKNVGHNYDAERIRQINFTSRRFCHKEVQIVGNTSQSNQEVILVFTGMTEFKKHKFTKLLRRILGDYCQTFSSLKTAENVDPNVKVHILDNFEMTDFDVEVCIYKIFEANSIGIPVVLCDDAPVINPEESWYWDRIRIYPFNTRYNNEVLPKERDMTCYFLKKIIDLELHDPNLVEEHRKLCRTYQRMSVADQIISIPKMIRKECPFYAFYLTKLDGLSFRNLNLCGILMTKMTVTDCDFSGSNLRGSKLDYSDFKNTTMIGCDFKLASMIFCIFDEVDFTCSAFTEANVAKSRFIKSNFEDSDMENNVSQNSFDKCIMK